MSINEAAVLSPTVVTWLATEWEAVLTLLAALFAVVWVWNRTRSTHIFTAVLWRRALGRREGASTPLKAFLDDRDELMHFRASTGLYGVATVAEAQRIAQWTVENDLDIELVGAAGEFVDLQKLVLKGKAPTARLRATLHLSFALLIIAALGVSLIGASSPPFLRVVKSDTWYEADPKRSRTFAITGRKLTPTFSKDECVEPPAIASRTRYPLHDVKVICEALTTPQGIEMIRDAQHGQWVITGVASFVIFAIAWMVFQVSRSADAADKLNRRLQARSKSKRR